MLTRSTWQAVATWLTLLSLGHIYNVWIGVLGAFAINIFFVTNKED